MDSREQGVVLVVTADRALQAAVDTLVAQAGCRSAIAGSVTAAARRIERLRPVLILVHPAWHPEARTQLGAYAPVVAIPVRTSATGVRRLAKSGADGSRWLRDLISERCARQTA